MKTQKQPTNSSSAGLAMWSIKRKWHRSANVAAVLLLASSVAQDGLPQVTGDEVSEIVSRVGIDRGIGLLLDPNPADLAIQIARQRTLLVYLQLPSEQSVVAARKRAEAAGLLGSRIFVEQGTWDHIHLADDLVDLAIVTPKALAAAKASRAELLRVINPLGTLYWGNEPVTKPLPDGVDDWTHPYHGPDNNPQSRDRVARAPYLTRFLAKPYFVPPPGISVAAGGRLFRAYGNLAFHEREWPWRNKLIAMNAFNGTILWTHPLVEGFNIHRNTLLATPERVFLGDSVSCKVLEAATGRLECEIHAPDGAVGPVWKWMAIENGILYGLVGKEEFFDPGHRKENSPPGWPWNGMSAGYDLKEYPWGFGRTFFAIDAISKKVLWVHEEPNRIDSRGVCMKGGRIYCYSEQKYLACLDAQTGKPAWRASDEELLKTIGPTQRAQNWGAGMSTFGYMMCSDQAVYFVGPHRLRLVAVSTEDGSLVWHHPFGNYRPILRQEGLYAMAPPRTTEKTLLLDPLTGKILARMDFRRSACTRPTGSYDSIFCRAHNNWGTSRLTVADQRFRRLAPMRPPCHDGVITTAGLLHWGAWICDCGVSMIGNITLAPAGNFDFAAEATEAERLETGAMLTETPVAPVSRGSNEALPGDWPTLRADNQRSAFSPVDIPEKVSQVWQHQPPGTTVPAAPITYRQMVFTSGSDGVIRAIRAADGNLQWTAYTGGPITYPPAIEHGRLLTGSGDGWVYCFDAGTGRRLWRFRAAPSREKIPVYGQLASRWPIGSGVLVDRGVVYAAAGIASYDGTHVFALDAATGRIRWQNHTSGHLPPDSVVGVSVQGHLLLHEDKLYMPGGNVVSPAVYDIRDGRCLNVIDDEWKADATPRGRDLFVIGGKVVCFDRRLYGPQRYWPGRRNLGPLTRAQNGETVLCDVGGRVARVVPETVAPTSGQKNQKLQVLWKSNHLEATEAMALGNNAVVVAGRLPSVDNVTEPTYALAALQVNDGKLLWSHSLPAMPASWGLALNDAGQIVVTLAHGHVMCYGRQP